MSRHVRTGAQLIALVCVAGMLALLVWKLTHQQHAPPIGAQAPLFSLPVLESPSPAASGSVSLSALRGHPVVLNFWASWCGPCKSEAPVLEQDYRQYENRVMFVGIDDHDVTSDARTFVNAHGLRFLTLADGSGDVTSSYGISQLPETYVLNAKGKVVAHIAGPINGPGYASQFRAALEKVS